ncbi:TonB-dependent hemoglobin/transferrin/lactoferrin family receptor [Elongatibacter sediminis]|uniref:TonB-dependent hemoglobin/transferrin/lactoferrin family receptor n=1 Tax=Elongatibacter sediminis TaxID=3119006 RepID=A0AAW9RFQ4_9GAMM
MLRALILPVLLLPGFAVAQMPADEGRRPGDDEHARELDPIVVVASRAPRPLSEVAAQVSVIDAARIRSELAEGLDDLLRYEPGLELETAGSRFGGTGISIRGIGGNRVAIEQDGIPVRDRFAVGSYSDGGRNLVETDRIKRVEVLHGPASVLYGSNALGGVVSITTFDPDDVLARGGGSTAGSVRGAYRGADASWAGSGVAALGSGPHALMAAYTRREGHETEAAVPHGQPLDPQDWDSQDGLLRYTYDTASGHRLRLTAAAQERDVTTDVFSQLGYGRRFGGTTALRGVDHDESSRLVADFLFAWGGWEQGLARVYVTDYETDQRSFERREAARVPVSIDRRFVYGQQHTGIDFNLFRSLYTGAVRHRVGLGLEWLQTESSEFRDGLQTDLASGQSTTFILGETMPVRDFPNSRSRELGLYVQDEITLADGRWELIPALRWDRYELDPRPDALWRADYPDAVVVRVDEDQLTPRLGVLFHGPGDWTLYGQYTRGFRAPPFEDANIGFDIALFGYRAIPNPDLESETSDGFEFGVRRVTASSRFSVALFHTDYDDFIESRALIGPDPVTGDLIFQSRNIDSARIYGIDVRFDQDLGAWWAGLDGWSLRLAGYWSEGENRETGAPLNSIVPPQAVVGLDWISASGAWDAALSLTATASKDGGDIDAADGPRFATDGWGVVDLTAGWRPGRGMELRAGVFNLGDKTYWRWLDVANLDAADPMIAALARPGRNLSATFSLRF